MLEAIGGMTVFGIIVIIVLKYHTVREDKKFYRENYSKYSPQCQYLLYEYNQAKKNKKPFITSKQLIKEMDRILSSHSERKIIDEAIRNEKIRKHILEMKMKEYRKIGYKYEEDIFSIFNNKNNISTEYLLSEIEVV
ncbi:hypothetical protein CHU92_10360 [Flavobacterium cyanobacteriorum]|uniref:Uncharacterized protein n=1 Tax=Flavobacterium cyanobacteriorum TaxID=2022802 RepID=A0A255Z3G8_9FLAO|nr:hypothetical protein [Flavobacterium cyanobacteriorum]OYQ36063.1 hypothetical protein CHU92_10360 [Flavobacterium cyanobacteriorum]